MAHVVDFTLFYGGIASAPVADLPFAGCSFDVQEGTARRAVLGEPEFESVAIAEGMGGIARTAPAFGVPMLGYTALWSGAGGLSRSASLGTAAASTSVDIAGLTAGARTSSAGTVAVTTTCDVAADSVPARSATFGVAQVTTSADVVLEAVSRVPAMGTATVLNAVTLDMRSAGASVAAFGAFAATTAVDLGGLSAGARTAAMGAPEVRTTWTAQPAAVPGREPAFGGLAAEIAAAATLEGFAYEADFGAPEWLTIAEVELDALTRTASLGAATVFNAVTLDMGGLMADSSRVGDIAVTTSVDLEGLTAGTRGAIAGSPDVVSTVDVGMDSVPARVAACGMPVVLTTARVDAGTVPDIEPVMGDTVFYSAVTLDMGGYAGSASMTGALEVQSTALAAPDSLVRKAVLGEPSIAIDVFPASVERSAVLGEPVAYSVRDVAFASVADTPAQIGGAVFYSAVTLDLGGYAHSAPAAGKVEAYSTALVQPAGLTRLASVGRPSIAIDVFPSSVEYEAAFGAVTAHVTALAEPVSLPDTAPALGAAEFYSAVTLDFASVVTAAPVAGQTAVTTAADVELDGFTHEAALGRPGIAIDVHPASVERVPMVGSASFATVRDIALASVPDTPAQVNGAAFESVAFVRFAGLEAGSAVMGGGVDVDTEALIRPAGILRVPTFGELGITVIVQPESLVHESAIGGAYLIPAHTIDMAAMAHEAAFGVPAVRIGVLVEPESVPAGDRAFGMPEWTWRKCPRHDRRAVLWQAHELEGRIRPAPKKVQEWKGTASVKRAQEADAVVCLAVEQRTVARRKNTTTAAIRREERI